MARAFSDLLDRPAYEGAVRVASYHLDRAARAIQRLETGDDPAALHDFRVSLRRLRTGLQAHEPYLAGAVSRKQRRILRDLASSTGGGRDAEVHIAWLKSHEDRLAAAERPGYAYLLAALEAKRRAGYDDVLREAPSRFRKLDRRLRRRLERLRSAAQRGGLIEGVPFGTAMEHVLPEYADQLDVHLSRLHTPSDSTEGHRARIRAKRLRYVLEPLRDSVEEADDLVTRLKELQDLLGQMHDAQVLEADVGSLGHDLPRGSAELRPGLQRVLDWLKGDQADRFESLRVTWLGGRSAAFFEGVDRVRRVVGTVWQPDVEIERKYLLSRLPTALRGRDAQQIDQGYLPGERLMERVRRIRENGSERFVRTVKMGTGIRRTELQEETDARVFRTLWPLTEGRRLTKRRFRVPFGGLVWEIDEFTDRDLVIAEVEIPSIDAVPTLPDWLEPFVVREVTGEAEYVNVNLAR